ncbi:MAG: hypothetical protein R2932_09955 [Caldilineaceae bacterium]
MDLASMKDLSGGHQLTGRHNHGRQVEWGRTHTLVFLTNHLPHVNSQSLAEWDRIKVLTFPVSFVNDPDPKNLAQRKKDTTLARRLTDELPGILNWLIAGCLEWRRNGLQTPESVKRDTLTYKGDEDTLGHFEREYCITRGDEDWYSEINCNRTKLHNAYKNWALDEGFKRPLGKSNFFKKMEERGYSQKTVKGERKFAGIGLQKNRF